MQFEAENLVQKYHPPLQKLLLLLYLNPCLIAGPAFADWIYYARQNAILGSIALSLQVIWLLFRYKNHTIVECSLYQLNPYQQNWKWNNVHYSLLHYTAFFVSLVSYIMTYHIQLRARLIVYLAGCQDVIGNHCFLTLKSDK